LESVALASLGGCLYKNQALAAFTWKITLNLWSSPASHNMQAVA